MIERNTPLEIQDLAQQAINTLAILDWPCGKIAAELAETLLLEPQEIVYSLRDCGYAAVEIIRALSECHYSDEDIAGTMHDCGYSIADIVRGLSYRLGREPIHILWTLCLSLGLPERPTIEAIRQALELNTNGWAWLMAKYGMEAQEIEAALRQAGSIQPNAIQEALDILDRNKDLLTWEE